MIKHFCDVCGAEIPDGNHSVTTGEATLRSGDHRRPMAFGVTVRVERPADEPEADLCVVCVFSAVDRINPLPREATG